MSSHPDDALESLDLGELIEAPIARPHNETYAGYGVLLSSGAYNRVVDNFDWFIGGIMRKCDFPVYVAGGYIRDLVAGAVPNDIDLFTDTSAHVDDLQHRLIEAGYKLKLKTKNAITFCPRDEMGLKVQIITRWLYEEGAEQVIRSFDFSCCQAVVWFETEHESFYDQGHMQIVQTEAQHLRCLCSPRFETDVTEKRLYYTQPIREEERGGSFMRMLKFVKRGYSIGPDSVALVTARLVDGCYRVAFDFGINNTVLAPDARLIREALVNGGGIRY